MHAFWCVKERLNPENTALHTAQNRENNRMVIIGSGDQSAYLSATYAAGGSAILSVSSALQSELALSQQACVDSSMCML